MALLSQDEIVLTSPGDEADALWFAGLRVLLILFDFPFFSVERHLKCLSRIDKKERRSFNGS